MLHWIGTRQGATPYVNPHTLGILNSRAAHQLLRGKGGKQSGEESGASRGCELKGSKGSSDGGGVEASGVVAAMSSVMSDEWGSPERFVCHAHDGATCNITKRAANSWMSVDLGGRRRLQLEHYCLRHGGDSGDCRLRKWQLEGSNHDDDDDDDGGGGGAAWTVLDTRNEKPPSLEARAFSQAAFKVAWHSREGGETVDGEARARPRGGHPAAAAAAAGFRRFRLVQTGLNSDEYDTMFCAGIELYGTLSWSDTFAE